MCKRLLLPSLLYTEGSEKVKEEVEKELELSDPKDAYVAIARNTKRNKDENKD